MVGAGFGGLAVAKGLADSPVDVVVVDANNFHTFQPLLYQVATAGLDADDIAHPVRGIVARHRNADVRLGRVTRSTWTLAASTWPRAPRSSTTTWCSPPARSPTPTASPGSTSTGSD